MQLQVQQKYDQESCSQGRRRTVDLHILFYVLQVCFIAELVDKSPFKSS
jgi:hypothetical protein